MIRLWSHIRGEGFQMEGFTDVTPKDKMIFDYFPPLIKPQKSQFHTTDLPQFIYRGIVLFQPQLFGTEKGVEFC